MITPLAKKTVTSHNHIRGNFFILCLGAIILINQLNSFPSSILKKEKKIYKTWQEHCFILSQIFNPTNSKSDQELISPDSNIVESFIKIMRTEEMTTMFEKYNERTLLSHLLETWSKYYVSFFFHLSGWIHVRCERFHATGSTFMHKFQICKLVVLAVLPATLLRSLATFVHPSVSNLCQTRLFTFIGMS